MARKSLGFVFGVVVAMGVFLAITTWAASPNFKRFGCASEGHDLPAGPLEGVLRLRRGTHLHFDMRGGAINQN